MKTNNIFCGMLAVMLLSVLTSSVFSQRKEVACDKFEEIKRVADRFLSSEPYRVRRTFETFKGTDTIPTKVSKSMTEYLPSGSVHNLYGLDKEDKKERSERIKVGDTIFTKKGDADWVKLTSGDNPPPPKAATSSKMCFAFPKEKLDGKDTAKFEVETSFKSWQADGKEVVLTGRMTYWFSNDRHFVKTIGETDKSRPEHNRTTDTYEYDPKIKIEAPIK